MRPKKKRVGAEPPDAIKDEAAETIGGTDNEGGGDDGDWGRTVPDEDAGYGRPQEQGDDDELI